MEMIKTNEEIENLKNNGGIALYQHYIDQFEEDLFFKPKGVHGVLHMKRVLLHAISLIKELGLNDLDSRILCLAALYHDIGRTNDYYDTTHGDKSWDKVVKLDLLRKTADYDQEEEINEQDTKIVEFIIRNHCLPDFRVWNRLKWLDNPEKDRIEYLTKIFKDSDNLDRVRFPDLDTRYLRLEESLRRVDFAYGILEWVK